MLLCGKLVHERTQKKKKNSPTHLAFWKSIDLSREVCSCSCLWLGLEGLRGDTHYRTFAKLGSTNPAAVHAQLRG